MSAPGPQGGKQGGVGWNWEKKRVDTSGEGRESWITELFDFITNQTNFLILRGFILALATYLVRKCFQHCNHCH